jgi:hypothetical protein
VQYVWQRSQQQFMERQMTPQEQQREQREQRERKDKERND